MTKGIDAAKFASLMDERQYYPCVAQFHNETPGTWNVTIIAIGALFHYDDGSSIQVGPTPVNLTAGATQSLTSPDIAKCVQRVTGALTAIAPGHPQQSFGKDNTCPPDSCMQLTHFVLAPKPAIAKAEFAKRRTLSDLVHTVEKV